MTRQGKAEPLDAKQHSIGAGRLPSNGASQGDQGQRGRDPERGTERQKHRLWSSRRHRGPGPLSTPTHLVLGTKQEGARASKYFLRRRTTPTDELSCPPGKRPDVPGGNATPFGHIKGKIAKYPLAESLDSTKCSGATVEYHD